MRKIYGSMLCGDCVKCRADLEHGAVDYEFLDLSEELSCLKEFLKIRDGNPLFDEARAEGKIGIPCIVREDSLLTLSWEEYLNE